MRAFKARNNVVLRMPAVEQGQQTAVKLAVQQRIEPFRNQQRLRFPDRVRLHVRSKRGELDQALVLRRDSRKQPLPGNRGLLRRHLGFPCRSNRYFHLRDNNLSISLAECRAVSAIAAFSAATSS